MGVRNTVADAIAADHPELTVYPYPPDVVDVPSVAISPNDEYQRPSTFGRGGAAYVAWAFRIQLVVHRADVESSLDLLEALRVSVATSITNLDGSDLFEVSGGRWDSFGDIAQGEVGEMPVLIGQLVAMVKAVGP